MTRFSATIVLALFFSTASLAGPGHDHGDSGPAPVAGSEMPRMESTGSDFELVATAEGHTLTIYLDRIETNEPVDGATVEVSGDGIAAITAKPAGEGTYEIDAEWVDTPGVKALIFTVTAGDAIDLLNGTLDIHGPDKAEAAPPIQFKDVIMRPELWIFAGIALLVGFFAAFAFRPARTPPEGSSGAGTNTKPKLVDATGNHMKHAAELVLVAAMLGLLLSTPALSHEGHDEGPAAPTTGNVPRRLPSGEAFVPKPSQRLLHIRTLVTATESAQQGSELIGTVIPNPSSAGHVQAPMDGQIELAERGISYVGQRVTTGEVLAALAPAIPIADLGTMEQLRADVDGKLRVAEQKLSRLTRIASVVAQSEIEDTKAELEALREQKRVLAPKGVERILLKAPVSGVISVANVRAGQVVSLRDTLFEIVDPEQLWVEAIGRSTHEQRDVIAAHALDSDGHSIKLSFIGKSPILRQQSLPLLFKVEDKHALAIGSTVKVVVQSETGSKKGIILPDAAVVRGTNGLSLVWEKVSAERFKPVNVRTVPLDGARVLVIAGVGDGTRIVVEGAELINQIR